MLFCRLTALVQACSPGSAVQVYLNLGAREVASFGGSGAQHGGLAAAGPQPTAALSSQQLAVNEEHAINASGQPALCTDLLSCSGSLAHVELDQTDHEAQQAITTESNPLGTDLLPSSLAPQEHGPAGRAELQPSLSSEPEPDPAERAGDAAVGADAKATVAAPSTSNGAGASSSLGGARLPESANKVLQHKHDLHAAEQALQAPLIPSQPALPLDPHAAPHSPPVPAEASKSLREEVLARAALQEVHAAVVPDASCSGQLASASEQPGNRVKQLSAPAMTDQKECVSGVPASRPQRQIGEKISKAAPSDIKQGSESTQQQAGKKRLSKPRLEFGVANEAVMLAIKRFVKAQLDPLADAQVCRCWHALLAVLHADSCCSRLHHVSHVF